ncbi:MAG: hypothetical protein HOQ32_09420 [Lysobacter sp.]|nr:hypothetical protein [Lysobacter sp.]
MATEAQKVADIQKFVRLFLAHCSDRESLLTIEAMAGDRDRWREGHKLFQQIRSKTLLADRAGDRLKVAQYVFEEVCAKTLYNLSGSPAPFDKDAPDWIRPNALALAEALGIPGPQAPGAGA